MKFSHAFETALREDEYPAHWVQSAIRYRQLKKCIKQVQKELSDIGLEPKTLKDLWMSVDACGPVKAPLQYTSAGDETHFEPKLIINVEPGGQMPLGASLAPETRAFLQNLVMQLGLSIVPSRSRRFDEVLSTQGIEVATASGSNVWTHLELPANNIELRPSTTKIEIPLTSDSTFFKLLSLDMSGLNALQSKEVDGINRAVVDLGREVSQVADPPSRGKKTDLYPWREIFRLYTESDVFFSTSEQSQLSHNSTVAAARLQAFLVRLQSEGLPQQLRIGSRRLLDRFICINLTLLKNLKFQELNITAMNKILKSQSNLMHLLCYILTQSPEFDKRTALGARDKFPSYVTTEPFSSPTVAKRVCFQMSEKLVAIIPQLNDYLCPVCFSVSFKPIRLRCRHVFCVRCMLVMQRANSGHCPLCRENVIMDADSANIDPALMNFLIRYFPNEVKAKQRENERNAAIDKFGKDASICRIM